MERRSWLVGRQVEPAGIHLALSPIHQESTEEYLRDLRDAVDEARGKSARSKVGVSTY